MIVGVPREIKAQESRVGMVPAGVAQLTRRGVGVLVESGAGVGADYPDEEYVAAGAEVVADPETLFARADLIVKVKEPQAEELGRLREGQLLFTYLHLAADQALTEALVASGATGIAYETIQIGHRLPLLEPMSEVAGRMSVMVGAYFLAKHAGGRGTLLGGVPGVLPGRVTILGGGTSGTNAAKVATGIGADTTILEIDAERMVWLDTAMPGARTVYSSEAALLDLLPRTDLLIGAVLVPGAKAPKLVTREMLGVMRKGTVVVDIAVDQGGLCRNHSSHHARRSGLCRRGGDSLLRGEYARRLRSYFHAGSHQCHPALCAGIGAFGLGGRLCALSRIPGWRELPRRTAHLRGGG